ncbi:MAG TPA: DUF86 domain-containing protein [Candidatus Paceibacterota bacterium]
MDKDQVYREDILSAIDQIEAFVRGMNFEQFVADRKTQSACLMQFVVIGETVNKLSAGYTASHPIIAWQEVVATRNIIIHQYTRVDMAIVWHTIVEDLPLLRKALS